MSDFKALLKKILPSWLYSPLLDPYHFLRAVAANIKYGFPARKLKVIAVTGTNGKTTTADLIASVLEAADFKVGLSTTALFKIGNETWDNDLNMTVTNPYELQALLKRMKEAQVDWVVLETTSHALSQYRIWGVPIHTAVITNLAADHLDYHKTMERYAGAKAKLVKMAKQEVVLNRDDDWFEFFTKRSSKAHYTYGTNLECDVRLTKANLKPAGSKIGFNFGEESLVVDLKLPGKFNVYNALAAAAVGLGLQLKPSVVKRGLESLKGVPGRMEPVMAGQPFSVLVDYAHAPDAFIALFETMRPLTKGRLIAVFGGAGERDPNRWPGMGHAAGRLTDVAIVTDDEPHSEDPNKIRSIIVEAAKSEDKAKVVEEADRKQAFKIAFKMGLAGDTILLLCLGHQKYRLIGNKKVPWDDRQVAREVLKDLNFSKADKRAVVDK